MPSIDSYQSPVKARKFEKKSYRPWNDLESPKDSERGSQDVVHGLVVSDAIQNSIESAHVIETQKKQTHQENEFTRSLYTQTITEHSSFETVAFALSGLRTIQRQLVFFIVELCIARRQLSSGPITHEMLLGLCNTNVSVIKNAIHRLVQKGYLVREIGKKGQGGFSSFTVSETLKSVVMNELQKKSLSHNKVDSSNVPFSEHTKGQGVCSSLPSEWVEIDWFPLDDIRFSQNHIEQLYKQGKLSAQQVQESIYAFAFDLKENQKGKTLKVGPLNYFMGILRNGIPYAANQNYEDPMEKELKGYISRIQEREEKLKKLEEEAILAAIPEWEKTLTEEEILNICQGRASAANDPKSIVRKGCLFTYFKTNHWPQLKEKIFHESNLSSE